MKHKSMLANPGWLRIIGVERTVHTYVPYQEHEGDVLLSSGDS